MIKYRKATINDIPQIAELAVKLHLGLTKPEALDEGKSFFTKDDVIFVAVDGQKIIAYAHGSIRRDYVEGSEQPYRNSRVGYFESVYVLPKYRKSGVARELVNRIEAWAKNKGCIEFASDCYASNKASRAFHKAIGFETEEKIVHFIKKL